MLLTGDGSRSWPPYLWHHCCISMSSHHMGQTYRMWVDDMLMWRDHPTFLSTGARSPSKNVSPHVHLNAGMYVLKRSRSLNYTLPCTKNNVWCQLVEIMTYSRVNDKFPHKQTLTECIFEPYMSRLRQPWYHQIPYWALMFCHHLWCITHQYTQRNDSINQSTLGECISEGSE